MSYPWNVIGTNDPSKVKRGRVKLGGKIYEGWKDTTYTGSRDHTFIKGSPRVRGFTGLAEVGTPNMERSRRSTPAPLGTGGFGTSAAFPERPWGNKTGGSGTMNLKNDYVNPSVGGGGDMKKTGFWDRFKGNELKKGQMGWGHLAVGALGAVALDKWTGGSIGNMIPFGGSSGNASTVYNQQQTGPRYNRTYNYYR